MEPVHVSRSLTSGAFQPFLLLRLPQFQHEETVSRRVAADVGRVRREASQAGRHRARQPDQRAPDAPAVGGAAAERAGTVAERSASRVAADRFGV